MRWYKRMRTFALTLGVSCVSMRGSSTPATPSAEIGADFARFVFPREPDTLFSWYGPSPDAHLGNPEYFWNIEWDGREQYTDPELISVIVRWDSTGMRRGTLAALLRTAHIEVGTPCIPCEPPAFSISKDTVLRPPAIAATADKGAVVITVRGRVTIARLFPQIPDSVSISISRLDGSDDEIMVPVRKPR
jgi:hypothetical protein